MLRFEHNTIGPVTHLVDRLVVVLAALSKDQSWYLFSQRATSLVVVLVSEFVLAKFVVVLLHRLGVKDLRAFFHLI